jgi:putative Holliday junction resolvase
MNTRVLAIDYGEKRIGLAISDEYAKLALPYEMVENKGLGFIVEEIGRIVEDEGVGTIVVGLPKSLRGGEIKDQELDKFVANLRQKIGLEIILFDERMSSAAADKFKLKGDLKETGWRDKVSAAIILQDYLDSI